MAGRYEVLSSGGPDGRLGALVAAGRRIELPPFVPRPYRVTDDWVLCVVTTGSGEYRTEGSPAQRFSAPAAILAPPRVPHWYGTERPAWTETWAVFRGPLFDLLREDAGRRTGGVHPLPDRVAARRLRHVLAAAGPAEHQLLDLFDWLRRCVPPRTPSLSPAVGSAADMLGRDLADPLSMPEVAARLGLGYDAFRRSFTAEVGLSPLAYRTERRLTAAANLLTTTDMTIRAIARAAGFTDEFHLSRRFRAWAGRSPSAYRREQAAGGGRSV